jgi:hypothetical protein
MVWPELDRQAKPIKGLQLWVVGQFERCYFFLVR